MLHSYLLPSNIPLYGSATCCVSIHPLMDIWVVSTFWLFWIMLLWPFVYTFLYGHTFISKEIPGNTQRRLLCEGLSAAMISWEVVLVLLLPGSGGRAHGTSRDVESGRRCCVPSLFHSNARLPVPSYSDSWQTLLLVVEEQVGFGLEARFCLLPLWQVTSSPWASVRCLIWEMEVTAAVQSFMWGWDNACEVSCWEQVLWLLAVAPGSRAIKDTKGTGQRQGNTKLFEWLNYFRNV